MNQRHVHRSAHLALIEAELKATCANIRQTHAALSALSNTTQALSQLISSLPPPVLSATDEIHDPDFDLKLWAEHLIDAAQCAHAIQTLLKPIESAAHIFGTELSTVSYVETQNRPPAAILPFSP